MKLKNIYNSAVSIGIKNDPRGKSNVRKELIRRARDFKKLDKIDKNRFDKESLSNPYADTRILYGDIDAEIKDILIGIDIEPAEVLLADRLIQKGENIDLIVSHHPSGFAYANFYEVMHLQIGLLAKQGIPVDIARSFLDKRIKEVERRVSAANHNRSVDVAKLLGIPFMCMHTVADNCVYNYLETCFEKNRPKKVKDIVSILLTNKEYVSAQKDNSGPKIIVGKPENPTGKILVEMTGGTEGSKELYARLSQAGVGTIVNMHLSEEHYKKIETEHINVVIAGHISSDNLGLNLLLDRIDPLDELNIIGCSGFRRVRRK